MDKLSISEYLAKEFTNLRQTLRAHVIPGPELDNALSDLEKTENEILRIVDNVNE